MNTLNLVGYIGIGLLIFIVFREVLTWYWKINKIAALLEEIAQNTRAHTAKEELPANTVPENKPTEGKPTGSVWREGKWVSE